MLVIDLDADLGCSLFTCLASYEEALNLAERVGEPQLLVPCYDGLATLSLDAGNVAMAEVYLAKSQKLCERAGHEVWRGRRLGRDPIRNRDKRSDCGERQRLSR